MDAIPTYSLASTARSGRSRMTGELESGRFQLLEGNLRGREIPHAGGWGAFIERFAAQESRVTAPDFGAMFPDAVRVRPDASVHFD